MTDSHLLQSGMEFHEDLPRLVEKEGLKGRKQSKAVESFAWNITVLKVPSIEQGWPGSGPGELQGVAVFYFHLKYLNHFRPKNRLR